MTTEKVERNLNFVDVILGQIATNSGAEHESARMHESTEEWLDSEFGRVPRADAPAGIRSLDENSFVPATPTSLSKARLTPAFVEGLLLKVLLYRGLTTGVDLAGHIGLLFGIVEKVLHRLKNERLVELKGQATLNDYFYELTDFGIERARQYVAQCPYGGAAPVALEDYYTSVAAQSPKSGSLRHEDLRRAFEGLTLSSDMIFRIGRAMLSRKGLFLHGPPGNGKSSIAERITRAFGSSIWIPRALLAAGQIVRLYDPTCHEARPENVGEFDRRWVRIRRPTVIVGGELRMESLDITPNRETGASEAPLQLKSNCGTLVIDDFGRQQISPAALLNRWIVPLERRRDYLNLPGGGKLQVPFEQFIIFSTNLEPKSLVDEAFLRRIPYKINVPNPTEKQFRGLFKRMAEALAIAQTEEVLDHLISRHYSATDREFRFCHPRDLLHHVAVYCDFHGLPRELTVAACDAAAGDYFAAH